MLCVVIQELGLPVGAHIPMLGFIGRLDYQKGVDLIRDNHDWMMGEGVQLILLGSGRADLEQSLRSVHAHHFIDGISSTWFYLTWDYVIATLYGSRLVKLPI